MVLFLQKKIIFHENYFYRVNKKDTLLSNKFFK